MTLFTMPGTTTACFNSRINLRIAIHYSTTGRSRFAPKSLGTQSSPINNSHEQTSVTAQHFSSKTALSQPTLQVSVLIQKNMVASAHFTPADNRQARGTVNKRFNNHHTAQTTRTMQLCWGFTSIASTVVP